MKLSFMTITDWSMVYYLNIKSSVKIFNFYSMVEIGEYLNHLNPYPNIFSYLQQDNGEGDENTIQFDLAYVNQLLYDNDTFIDFMKIMMNLEIYDNVIVVTNYDNPYIMYVVESLIKIIQERYGIQSYIVNCIEDIDELNVSEFTQEGYLNYIQDMDRFKAITSTPELIMREGDIDEHMGQ